MPKIKLSSFFTAGVAFVAITLSGTGIFAQSTEIEPVNNCWVGVVTADMAQVRCGANESYYPIATVRAGDLVLVSGKKQDWFRVLTDGAAFETTVGYIKYPAENTTMFLVDGKNGTALDDVEVLAKNIESDDLYRSWRPVFRLKSGDIVQVVETKTTDPGTLHRGSYVVQTIKMPSGAPCWINSSSVKKATPEQSAEFYGAPKKENVNTVAKKDNASDEVTLPVDIALETDEAKPDVLEPLSLAELEAAWEKITSEPAMEAEVSPLRDMYCELLENSVGDLVVDQVAGGRIKQLNVWLGLQDQRDRIERLRADLGKRAGEVSEYQSIMAMNGEYVVIGKLALSNTFDGRLRPIMYRVQDLKSGRTLGYLPPNKDYDLSGLVGQMVGVAGKSTWDSTWRVSVIEGDRFDILSPTTAIVTPDIQ